MTNQALEFFNTIFSHKPPQSYILVWAIPGKTSQWFTDPAQAAEYVQALGQGVNVYFGIAYNPNPRNLLSAYEADNIEKIRCRADDTWGIPGVWLDLDVLGPGHKKNNLPRSDGEAYEILNSIEDFPPSMVVHSGGGLHAYWLFDKAYTYKDDPEERARMAALSERWQMLYRRQAALLGRQEIGQPFDVDSTFDLARVFRVPGSTNIKSKPPRQVVINQNSGQVYTPAQLEKFLDKEEIKLGEKPPKKDPLQTVVDPDLVLRKDGKLDGRFMELYSDPSERKFRQSWDRKRKDLQDQSSSGYDLSIATILHQYGWTDQEIVDALIINHNQHGDDLKMNRPDYYARTLARAKLGLSQQQQIEAEQVKDFRADAQQADTVDKAQILSEVSEALGIRVTKWVKYFSEPVTFILEIDGAHRVSVGDGGAVLNAKRFAQAVYNACDIALPGFKTRQWNNIVNKLGLAKVVQVPDAIETATGHCRYYMIKYLNDKVLAENMSDAVQDEQPFFDPGDGARYFFLENLKNYIKSNGGVPLKSYSDALRQAGSDTYTKSCRINGKPSSRSVWRFPDDI
jgi:hypothetical protein